MSVIKLPNDFVMYSPINSKDGNCLGTSRVCIIKRKENHINMSML